MINAFQRCVILNSRNYDFTVISSILLANEDQIPVINTRIYHRISASP